MVNSCCSDASWTGMTLQSVTKNEPGFHIFAEFSGKRFYVRSFHGAVEVRDLINSCGELSRSYPHASLFIVGKKDVKLTIDGLEDDLVRACKEVPVK